MSEKAIHKDALSDESAGSLSLASYVRLIAPVLMLMLMVIGRSAYSQGNIAMEQVDIVKSYEPLLADAEKITWQAMPVPSDTSKDALQYDVKPHLKELPFIPADARAVALPAEEPEPMQNNLLNAGFGMQLTPLIDLYLHNGPSDKFSYGAEMHHLSSNGSKIDYQDFSASRINLFGTAFVGSSSLSASAGYGRRKHYYYADTSGDDRNSLKRNYDFLPVELTFQNTKNVKEQIRYKFNFKYHHFDGKANAVFLYPEKEDYFNFNMLFQKEVNKIHSANLSLEFENLQNKLIGAVDTSQTLISVVPYYGLRWKALGIRAGVNVSVFAREATFFPLIHGEYKLIGDYLIPYVGWEGGWQSSGMQDLTTINPYLGNFMTSYSKFNVGYLGIRGSYGNHLSYNLKGSLRSQTNLPMYVPDRQNPAYYLVDYYYNVNISSIYGELAFRQSQRLNVIMSGEVNSYDMDFDDEPLGIPKARLTATLNYNIQDKIVTRIDFFTTSGAFTILPSDTIATQLPGSADASFSATYNYKKNIAFWVALNNIFGANSSRWYNYPTYGFQAMAGLKLKF